MSPGAMLATLLVAAAASWALRVLLVVALPPERLPTRVRETLPYVAPAVLAGLVAAALTRNATDAVTAARLCVTPSPMHLALLAAGLAAWRFRNLAAPMAAAMLVMTVARLLAG